MTPRAPDWMSVSTLLQIEACPRQWALRHGSYPELWSGRGYPPRPRLAAIEGRVVHEALRTVVRALIDAGCTSVDDERSVAAIRALGGYSAILSKQLSVVLKEFDANPRVRDRDELARRARSNLPAIRTTVQLLLRRATLTGGRSRKDADAGAASSHARRPLPLGVHHEVTVEVPAIRWRGTIDLLRRVESRCELVEYKTGKASPDHDFQVRAYAVLWRDDQQLNPDRTRITELTLVYVTEALSVPAPSDTELDATLQDMQYRAERARAVVNAEVPEARPSVDTCSGCDVRHLCDVYWRTREATLLDGYCDLEVRLGERRGHMAWAATTRDSSATPVMVIFTADPFLDTLHEGAVVRILNARITHEEHEGARGRTISAGPYTETFVAR
jgi:CRISPR/Cas system-associated exonuclease Cas4 (RecB family)